MPLPHLLSINTSMSISVSPFHVYAFLSSSQLISSSSSFSVFFRAAFPMRSDDVVWVGKESASRGPWAETGPITRARLFPGSEVQRRPRTHMAMKKSKVLAVAA